MTKIVKQTVFGLIDGQILEIVGNNVDDVDKMDDIYDVDELLLLGINAGQSDFGVMGIYLRDVELRVELIVVAVGHVHIGELGILVLECQHNFSSGAVSLFGDN